MIKYTKEKDSNYLDEVTTITTTGRSQAIEWLLLQDDTGEIHDGETVDPLDFDFTVKCIKKDGKVYLDANYMETPKQTVAGFDRPEESPVDLEQMEFTFPESFNPSNVIIIHGPQEIVGLDDDRLVVGVICRHHNSKIKSIQYRWFRDGIEIKSGNNNSIIEVNEPGAYFCQVEVDGESEKSEEITIQRHKVKKQKTTVSSLKSGSKQNTGLIPIIDVKELTYNKANEIGKGAFARVYKGTWIGSTVAIKFIEFKRGQKKLKSMIDDEVSINARIRHPNLVQLMSVAYDNTGIFLVTEYVNGFNMEDAIFDQDVKKNARLNLTDKISISIQCLQALSYLHGLENGIIHRDIKPANILITRKSHVTKICDLGVSRVKSLTSNSLTTLGGQPGTPNYMAPEVLLQGKLATTSSDIWSIGITLIEFFTEKEAWGEEICSHEEIKEELLKSKPPHSLEKITEPIQGMLGQCVQFNPDKRSCALKVLLAFQKIH